MTATEINITLAVARGWTVVLKGRRFCSPDGAVSSPRSKLPNCYGCLNEVAKAEDDLITSDELRDEYMIAIGFLLCSVELPYRGIFRAPAEIRAEALVKLITNWKK